MSTIRLRRASFKCVQSAGFWFSLKPLHQKLWCTFDYLIIIPIDLKANILTWRVPKIPWDAFMIHCMHWELNLENDMLQMIEQSHWIRREKKEEYTCVEKKIIISQHLKCSIYILIVTDAVHGLHCHNNIYFIYCYSKKFHITPWRASLWYSVPLFWKSPSVSTIWLNTICE